MIPILALICLLVIIYTILYYKINAKAVFAIKAATSFCFVGLGFYAREKSGDAAGNYPALVISGLLAGLLGDIVLGIRRIDAKRKTTYFIFGSALFFVGHIFYAAAFLTFSASKPYLYLLTGIVMAALIIITTNLSGVKCGKLKFLNYVYVLPLSFLIAVTGLNIIHNFTRINTILFAGAVSFALSDILLYFIYFAGIGEKNIQKIKAVNIAAYYLAQTLFAVSIYYL